MIVRAVAFTMLYALSSTLIRGHDNMRQTGQIVLLLLFSWLTDLARKSIHLKMRYISVSIFRVVVRIAPITLKNRKEGI